MTDKPKSGIQFFTGKTRFGHEEEGISYEEVSFRQFADIVREHGAKDEDWLDLGRWEVTVGTIQVIYTSTFGAKLVLS